MTKKMMKKMVKKAGENTLTPEVKESLKKWIPDSKVVMGRAHRCLFAARHIQFENRVSEDGCNNIVTLLENKDRITLSRAWADGGEHRVGGRTSRRGNEKLIVNA